MNEQANKILADLLQKASNGIDAAVSFSQAQIPDVIHQLLVWNFAKSITVFIISLLSIIPLVWLILNQWKRVQCGQFGKGEGYTWDEGKPKYKPTFIWDSKGDFNVIVMPFAAIVGIWVAAVLAAITDLTWLKIWIAPKLYLIEYAAHLIK